jgi:hypothetical protein
MHGQQNIKFLTVDSGQQIGLIFRGQESKDGTGRLSRNVGRESPPLAA